MTSGRIAGIIIGSLLGSLLAVLVIIVLFRYRSKATDFFLRRNSSPISTEQPNIIDLACMAIALKIKGDDIIRFGKELGYDDDEIQSYVARNSRHGEVTCDGTIAMLRDWDKRFEAIQLATLIKAARLAEESCDENKFALGESSIPIGRPTENRSEHEEAGDRDPLNPQNSNTESQRDQALAESTKPSERPTDKY